jgi:carbon monoxide dehydrogenase subunit G
LSQVRSAVLQSFRDLEIGITQDAPIVGGGAQITGEALHRKITVQLEPVTPALTRLKMSVRHGLVGKDRATSAELIDQTARALAEIRPIAGASRRAP